jgi:transposase
VNIVAPRRNASFPKTAGHSGGQLRPIRISAGERSQLEHWARSRTQHHRTVVRSRIVLLANRGVPVAEIATQVRVAVGTVRLWCRRFQEGGVAALARDASGRGRPAGMSRDLTLAVLRAMQRLPERERSSRRVAAVAGVSAASVWRVCKRSGLNRTSSASDLARLIEQLISETAKPGR